MKTLLLAAALALATCSAAFAASAPATFAASIGERPVTLPMPDGYVEPDGSTAKVRDLLVRGFPANYRLIDLLVPQTYLDQMHAHDPKAELSRYCVVVTYRNYEAGGMPPEVLQAVKTMMRDQADKAMKLAAAQAASASERYSKDLGKLSGDASTSIKVGNYKSLGVFDEGPNSIALAAVNPVSVTSRKGQEHYDQVIAMAFVLIHGKPVAISVYSDYDGQADIDWAEDQARDWVRRVNQLNP